MASTPPDNVNAAARQMEHGNTPEELDAGALFVLKSRGMARKSFLYI